MERMRAPAHTTVPAWHMCLVSISLYLLFTSLQHLSTILPQLDFQILAADAGIVAIKH